jgi:hypothetical protein
MPPPWTSDPILRSEFINNMYRELDPGTEYALKMLEAEDTPHNKLFNLTLYRLLGSKQEFFDTVGWQKLDSFQPRDFLQTIHSYRNSKGNPFGDAYRVAPYHTMGTSDKFENVTRLLEKLLPDFPGLYDRLLASASAREAYDHFKDTEGFGDFLSYQIVVDCITPLPHGGQLLPFSQDDWAVAGPGAKQGARKLCAADYNPGSYLPMMKWLRDNQADEFARLGLNFPYLKNIDGTIRALSLSNIQSTLCEFNKYSRIYDGASPVRRFYPTTRFDQLTRWGAVEHEVSAVTPAVTAAALTAEPNVLEREVTVRSTVSPGNNLPSSGNDQVVVFVVGVAGQVESVGDVVVRTIKELTSSFQHLGFVSTPMAGGEQLESSGADGDPGDVFVPQQELDDPVQLVHPRVRERRPVRRVFHGGKAGPMLPELVEDPSGDLTYAGLQQLGGGGADALGDDDGSAIPDDDEAGASETEVESHGDPHLE